METGGIWRLEKINRKAGRPISPLEGLLELRTKGKRLFAPQGVRNAEFVLVHLLAQDVEFSRNGHGASVHLRLSKLFMDQALLQLLVEGVEFVFQAGNCVPDVLRPGRLCRTAAQPLLQVSHAGMDDGGVPGLFVAVGVSESCGEAQDLHPFVGRFLRALLPGSYPAH